jgi:hypothetical protein
MRSGFRHSSKFSQSGASCNPGAVYSDVAAGRASVAAACATFGGGVRSGRMSVSRDRSIERIGAIRHYWLRCGP